MSVYLITGGTGFIGAHIIKRLIQQGEQIVVYDIVPRLFGSNSG